ncbi:MAG: class C sortase [Lachnospiraceae bacterium]|nr:class C sortase [Lachnospiraceae bacterium]
MKKKISNLITVFLVLILLAGLSLLLYPTFSDWWNSYHQTKAIASYAADVANLSNEDYEKIWKAATEYNASLSERNSDYTLTEEQKKQYEQLLNVSGDGIMGYIEIPSINCSLPIYHGTQESVLQIAVGHIEWSSLPVGGASSHCVVSGHRGLPSAKLFTNLDELSKGDTFMLRVLDEVLTYEVDQILIVEPQETGALQIEEGKDYCTLVTCTPYGINTHRLLVRGHRIDNIEEAKTIRVTADAIQIEPLLVAPVVATPILLLLIILLLLPKQPRKKHGDDADEED